MVITRCSATTMKKKLDTPQAPPFYLTQPTPDAEQLRVMSLKRLPESVDADRPLTTKQRELVDLILTTGKSVQQCADHLNRDVSNLYRDLRKPHVKKELQRRTLDHIGVLAPYAARCQEQLLSSHSDHVRAVVAGNILDRHLGKPIERKQIALGGSLNVTIDLS